jgi:hypothetical protein
MTYLAKGSKIIKLFAHPASGAAKWTIYKNDFGIPKYRYVSQLYTVFAKHGDSGKCFFERFFLKQNYSGGGTYSETVVGVDTYKEIECNRLGVK